MDEKEQSSNQKLLRGVADFIDEGHALGEERERLDDEIRAAGIDPEAYISNFKSFVEDRILEYRTAIHEDRLKAAAKMQALIENMRKKLAHMTPTDEKAWTAKLEPRLAGAYFRNFKSASTADKTSMIEDVELLEKLDQIMKEKGV